MATLFNVKKKDSIVLRSQHLFGRHAGSCHTLLDCPEASRMHATVAWNGARWLLQDNSSNGTFVNGAKIKPNIKQHIRAEDELQFGSMNSDVWQVQDDNPPTALLIPLNVNDKNKAEVIELSGVLTLAEDCTGLTSISAQEDPEASLHDVVEASFYQAEDGRWLCENLSGVVELNTGDKIATSLGVWLFVGVDDVESTMPVHQEVNKSHEVQAIFVASKNEEHVALTISGSNGSYDLGERTHHELMLYLARKRLSDRKTGVVESEQGWVDKELLSQQTGLDEKHINILIYRLRQQLILADSSHLKLLQVVERRRGALRFALGEICISGGNDLLKHKA